MTRRPAPVKSSKAKVSRKNRSARGLKAISSYKNRNKFLTFFRIIKYGIASFSRNAWLSIAATAIMLITLLVISATLVARNVLYDTIAEITSQIQMSIYAAQDTPRNDIDEIARTLRGLESVTGVEITSPEEARANFAIRYRDDPDALAALREAANKMPWIINVDVVDINDISELEAIVENDDLIRDSLDPDREPSFLSDRREAIDSIANMANFIERGGLVAGGIFVVIAALVIFNTIRMAIFNRREEIYMMKLIGANRSFIRGPFLIEAIHYGVIAAIITAALVIGTLLSIGDRATEFGIAIQPTIDLVTTFWPIVVIGLIAAGALIGVISALLATHRHLKLRD